MNITVKELLTTYWPQAVAIGGFVAFFVNRIFDLRSKKIEHKQETFQQHRIGVILDFMRSYNSVQAYYRRMLSLDFDFQRDKELLIGKTEELYSTYFYLRLFLDPMEMARYADLMVAMNGLLDKISANTDETRKVISDTLESNNQNFKVITKMFRENANQHKAIQL